MVIRNTEVEKSANSPIVEIIDLISLIWNYLMPLNPFLGSTVCEQNDLITLNPFFGSAVCEHSPDALISSLIPLVCCLTFPRCRSLH